MDGTCAARAAAPAATPRRSVTHWRRSSSTRVERPSSRARTTLPRSRGPVVDGSTTAASSAGGRGPLPGRRIAVTRAPEQAGVLLALLAARGARPLACPTIAIEAPESYAPLD